MLGNDRRRGSRIEIARLVQVLRCCGLVIWIVWIERIEKECNKAVVFH